MSDHLRIVRPKHAFAEAAAPTQANFVYNGGPLLTAIEVVNVFWGDWWTSQQALQNEIDAFIADWVVGPTMDILAEVYSVPGQMISHGTHTGSFVIAGAVAATVRDAQIRKMLKKGIADGTLPKPTPNALYRVMVPDGTQVHAFGSASCSGFCGYHNFAKRAGFYYAVLPYPSCKGCLDIAGAIDTSLTVVISHELAEAITDPVPGSGWYDQNNGEIGDICEGHNTTFVGASGKTWTDQRIWDQKDQACV